MIENIVCVIQCRVGSTRLPHKSLLCLHGHPIAEWVFQRLSRSRKIHSLVFAIPDLEQDLPLYWTLRKLGAHVFRGSENDVLARFVNAAKERAASHVIRVCGDNPLVDPQVIDSLVDFYFRSNCDYAYNHIPRENLHPDGLGAEICSFETLEKLNNKATLPNHREHLFNYLWDHKDDFKILTFDPEQEYLRRPELRFDIDTWQDFMYLSQVPLNMDIGARELISKFEGLRRF